MTSWHHHHGEDSPAVGSVFRQTRYGHAFETAEVLSVWSDLAGIPHVRFRRRIHRPSQRPVFEGDRTLALATFRDTFVEIDAAAP